MRLLPAEFRHRHATEIRTALRDLFIETLRERGARGLLGRWFCEALVLAITASRLHLDADERTTTPSRTTPDACVQPMTMKNAKHVPRGPRAVGITCAIAATGLGLLYMALAGAPTIHLAVNALSLVMGLALIAVIPPTALASRLSGGVVVILGGLLLATALFGVSVEGASRWIRVGGLSLQISLVVLPAMLVAFARGRGLLATIGVMLAAVALALQPDRAMAGVLAAALATLAMFRPDRWVVSTLAVAVPGFATTLMRPDSLPAVPYVDQILYTSFQVHALAGLAVVGGALLLIVPAVAGQWADPKNREVHAVFGTVWLGMVVAAALGNYPTPLVGYGGSAILGYALSLSFLPGKVRSAAVVGERASDVARTDIPGHPDLRIGVEYGKRSTGYLHPSVG